MHKSGGIPRPRMRYPIQCCAPRPATKFASTGLSRLTFVSKNACARSISEYASLVRKSYSDVSLQSVPSYWQSNRPGPEETGFPRGNRV